MDMFGTTPWGPQLYKVVEMLSLKLGGDLYLPASFHDILHIERLRESACIPTHRPSWH